MTMLERFGVLIERTFLGAIAVETDDGVRVEGGGWPPVDIIESEPGHYMAFLGTVHDGWNIDVAVDAEGPGQLVADLRDCLALELGGMARKLEGRARLLEDRRRDEIQGRAMEFFIEESDTVAVEAAIERHFPDVGGVGLWHQELTNGKAGAPASANDADNAQGADEPIPFRRQPANNRPLERRHFDDVACDDPRCVNPHRFVRPEPPPEAA